MEKYINTDGELLLNILYKDSLWEVTLNHSLSVVDWFCLAVTWYIASSLAVAKGAFIFLLDLLRTLPAGKKPDAVGSNDILNIDKGDQAMGKSDGQSKEEPILKKLKITDRTTSEPSASDE